MRPWIFFDLDDTLWDFGANSLQSLEHIFYSTSLLRSKFKNCGEFLECYHINNAYLWERYNLNEISSDFLRKERWRATLFPESLNPSDLEICDKIDCAYLKFLASRPGTIPGAQNLLGFLKDKYLLGIISNGFPDVQHKKLEASGLSHYFSRCIVSEEIGIPKPDLRIFQYAISETGSGFPPLMVGDNPDTDIKGALKAGWNAIWLNTWRDMYDTETIIKDMDGYPGKLIAVVSSLIEITNHLNETKSPRGG